MKKLLFLLPLLLLGNTIIVNGQTRPNQLGLVDFVNAYTHERSYDEDFTPILKLTFKNVSAKTITTIEIKANYQGYDPANYFAPICTRTVHTNIDPYQTKELSIRLDKDPNGNNPKSFWLTKVRFSDGSVIDK